MKYNIVKNVDKKTVTVVIGETRFFSAKYLLERYDHTRYFGNAVFYATPQEITNLVTQVSNAVNEVNPKVKTNHRMFFEGGSVEYPLFTKHLSLDDKWDGNSYSIKLSSFAEKRTRNFFFNDLARTSPVTDEEEIRRYEWAVEVEISTNVDEKTLEPKYFVIVHRIIKGKKLESVYQENDKAWEGFDLGEEKKKVVDPDLDDIDEDDLPF